MTPLVLKIGGELLETPEARGRLASAVAVLARTQPLVLIHGGGRAIDEELARRGIAPKKVDGLRVTDAATLDAVVAVLAGTANTELVAALVAAGVPAVGLTGVDAACASSRRAPALTSTSGARVDLGLVGEPTRVHPALFDLLLSRGYVPVVASLGIEEGGLLLNINADVMACRIAATLGAHTLIIAGATAGVLDGDGRTVGSLDQGEIDALIASGTASAGMVAKLRAAVHAAADGVGSVRIVDGRALAAGTPLAELAGTTVAAGAATLS